MISTYSISLKNAKYKFIIYNLHAKRELHKTHKNISYPDPSI